MNMSEKIAAAGIGYQPRAGSFAFKAIEFFTTNPDESLTPGDLSAKFDAPEKTIHSLLSQAVQTGILKRTPNDDEVLEYSLGTGTPAVPANKAKHPTLGLTELAWRDDKRDLKAKTTPNSLSKKLTQAELDALPIVGNFPIPPARQTVNYESLFQRMQINDSCPLPLACEAAVKKAAYHYKQKTQAAFTFRKMNDDELRLWRTA